MTDGGPQRKQSGRLLFDFQVGEKEVHRIQFSFDQIWGLVKIAVDGKTIIRDVRLLSFSRIKDYRFVVGEAERHQVLIRKERPWVGAAVRRQICHVFIDGEPAGDYATPMP